MKVGAIIPGIAITLPDGTLSVAASGPGLTIIPAVGAIPAVIQVNYPPPIQPQPPAKVPVQVWGATFTKVNATYVLAVSPLTPLTSLRLFRNGMRLFNGGDYTWTTAGVVTPLFPWNDDDTILADYSM